MLFCKKQERIDNQILHQSDGNHVSGITDVKWLVRQDHTWEILEWVDKHLENMQEKEWLCE